MNQLATSESAVSFFRNLTHPTQAIGIEEIDHLWKMPSNSLLYIQSSHGMGKSELICQALVHCILPAQFNDLVIGGLGKRAILLDADLKFTLKRFLVVLQSAIQNKISGINITPEVTTSLARLEVCQCASLLEFGASILTLLDCSDKEGVRLVAIDSLDAFYWQDKIQHAFPASHGVLSTKRIMELIDEMRLKLECPVLLSVSDTFARRSHVNMIKLHAPNMLQILCENKVFASLAYEISDGGFKVCRTAT